MNVTSAQTAINCPRCGRTNFANEATCAQCGNDLRGLSAISDTYSGVAIGRVIDGRYMLLAKLGDGGMGSVYRVEHVRMGKVMALKILRPDIARRKTAVDRFRREAKILSKMDHPNAITVFDYGETENGLLYLAMEYVPGRDLGNLLREEQRIEERRALRMTVQVLKALTAAHREGIIHRDVKPGNVMLTRSRENESEQVKLLDFGIAKLAHREQNNGSEITGGADLVGTPSCMSPEQARGLELDARSDVYSTSAMLFELLCGRGPFVGTPLEVVSQHLIAPVPKIRELVPQGALSETVEAVLEKGLAKDPKDRWQSADEMRTALERVLGAPISYISQEEILNIARREDWDAFEKSFKRSRYAMRALAVLILLSALAGAFYTFKVEEERPAVRMPVSEEVEPNDLPAESNLVVANKVIRGTIGTRRHPNVSDRDIYELNLLQEGSLTVEVSAVPNINMVIEVFAEPRAGNEGAPPIAVGDDFPTGMAEEITDLVLGPGMYLVRLSDKRRLDEPDGPPRENSSDPYSLLLKMEVLRAFQEREPNNEPTEASPAVVDMPVLGRAGAPGVVAVVRSGPAPFPTWSVDQYQVTRVPDGSNVCALLGGMQWSTLRLTAGVPHRDKPKLKSLASVQVREGKVGGLCAKSSESLYFEVRVDVGNTGLATYPLAFAHDKAGGLAGVIALAKLLPTLDRAAEARLIVERALEVLPRSPDAGDLKDLLRELPEIEGPEVSP